MSAIKTVTSQPAARSCAIFTAGTADINTISIPAPSHPPIPSNHTEISTMRLSSRSSSLRNQISILSTRLSSPSPLPTYPVNLRIPPLRENRLNNLRIQHLLQVLRNEREPLVGGHGCHLAKPSEKRVLIEKRRKSPAVLDRPCGESQSGEKTTSRSHPAIN